MLFPRYYHVCIVITILIVWYQGYCQYWYIKTPKRAVDEKNGPRHTLDLIVDTSCDYKQNISGQVVLNRQTWSPHRLQLIWQKWCSFLEHWAQKTSKNMQRHHVKTNERPCNGRLPVYDITTWKREIAHNIYKKEKEKRRVSYFFKSLCDFLLQRGHLVKRLTVDLEA